MGMYTELNLTFGLKKDTPMDVVKMLTIMAHGQEWGDGLVLPDHPFFRTERWQSMLRMTSYYHTPLACAYFQYDSIAEQYYFHSYSNFKDYCDEIALFLEWIVPHIDTSYNFIGYSRFEGDEDPALYYREELLELINKNKEES